LTNVDFIKTQFCWVDYTKKGIICQAAEKNFRSASFSNTDKKISEKGHRRASRSDEGPERVSPESGARTGGRAPIKKILLERYKISHEAGGLLLWKKSA
jgi:hypothetical protein